MQAEWATYTHMVRKRAALKADVADACDQLKKVRQDFAAYVGWGSRVRTRKSSRASSNPTLTAVEKLEPGPCDGIADDVPMTGGLLDADELPSEQRAQASGRPWQERAAMCACPRGCAMQLYPREGPVCDFCFVETEPQPNCDCFDDCPCHRFRHDSDEDPDEASRDPGTV